MHHLDLFGCVIGFRMNGYTRYKTRFGGAMTLFAGILGLVTISLFSQEFFKREEPRNILEEKKQFNPVPLNLLSNNFYFAVTVSFNDIHFLREEIFKISAFFVKIKNSKMSEQKLTKIDLIPCEEKFFQGQEKRFHELNLTAALCPEPNSFIEVKGSFINKEFDYLRIQFDFCDKNKDKKCKNMVEIENVLSVEVPKAHLYYMDSSINPSDYKYPLSYFINNYNIELTFGDMKESDISFMKTNLLSYNGYLLNDAPINYTAYAFGSARDKISVRTENRLDLMKLNLMASNKQIIIQRSYIKFSEVLANIGGLLNLIIIGCFQLSRYVNEFLFIIDMISNLFSYNDDILKKYKQRNEESPVKKMIDKNKKKTIKSKKINNFVNNDESKDKFDSVFNLKKKSNDNNKKTDNKENLSSFGKKSVEKYIDKNVEKNEELIIENSPEKNVGKYTEKNVEKNVEKNIVKSPESSVENSLDNTNKKKSVEKNPRKSKKLKMRVNPVKNKEKKENFFSKSLLSIIADESNVIIQEKDEKNTKKKAKETENDGNTLSFKQKLEFLLCPCLRRNFLRKNTFFGNLRSKISGYIEFKMIMKKIQEIDIIKYILFDNDQIELFNYISRPEINFQKKYDSDFGYEFQKYCSTKLKNEDEINQLTEKDLKKIVKAFKHILQKEELNRKDMRIIDAMNPDIKKLLAYQLETLQKDS